MIDTTPTNRSLQKRELELRWYQTRLGFWQAIWGTLVTGGLAVAIPAAVESYKLYQERLLKEQEIALKNKEIEGKLQDMDHQYISQFLKQALDPDIEMRIRFSQYFAYVSGNNSNREGWEKFRKALTDRRDEIRKEINQKETDVQKLREKEGSLSIDEKAQRDRLLRELNWDYSEVGSVNKVLQNQ
jgi:hypothetical protein